MFSLTNVIFYTFAFFSLYAQVFILLTFLENRKRLAKDVGDEKLAKYPKVTIIVPCWNEEKTVYKTVKSIFNLNYPKDKVKIILVDDGSTDNTWKIISKFLKYSNVKVFKKENGGKHTALNLGLENTDTEFVGCLDADSRADENSLVKLMSFFERYPDSMAVTPSIVVEKANSIVEKAQRAEYNVGVYVKKMLGFLGAIQVTPGPLTIYRKKVFDDLGPYRHAHNTEDMEIAYRMQKNHYKIQQCHDAFVYTGTPNSLKKLYKQRLRWIYGSINNTIDYRKVLFKKEYGNFSLFTLPSGIIVTIATGYIFFNTLYLLFKLLSKEILHYQAVGFNFNLNFKPKSFDLFFINTEISLFLAILLFGTVFVSIIVGYKMSKTKKPISMDIVYFISVFSFIAPFWLMKAVYNTIISRKPSWR